MQRVWFNHWFSTAYNLIDNIKKADSSNRFYFIGTGKKRMAYKEICEEFYLEPDVYGKDYIDFCLSFCKRNHINIFVPRKEKLTISKYIKEFKKIGVEVLVEDNYQLLSILEDKFKTAKLFNKYNLCKVPELLIANNLKEFKDNYIYLRNKYPNDRICFKYAIDEGALSFRVIDNSQDGISSLNNYIGSKISYDKTIEILSSVDTFNPIIQMIYLNGKEISIDSLNTNKGFIGCARTKIENRLTKIEDSSEYIKISENFAKITNIKHPYNLQLREHNGELYLLEVNTRMAGGTYKDSLMGYNFPYLALLNLLNEDFEIPQKFGEAYIETYETIKGVKI